MRQLLIATYGLVYSGKLISGVSMVAAAIALLLRQPGRTAAPRPAG